MAPKLAGDSARTVITGVDYSGGGPLTAAQCKSNGISFVCRYVSNTSTAWNRAKTVRKSEIDDFRTGGVGVVIVFESTPGDALGGYAQGAANARLGDAQVTERGIAGCPIYFAVDFDVVPSQYAVVDAYIDGAASVVGPARIGAYGSHRVITHLFDSRRIRYGWAAVAWGGVLDPRAHLFQYGGGTVDGVSVDWNRTVCSDTDYGQAQHPPPIVLPGSWLGTLMNWSTS